MTGSRKFIVVLLYIAAMTAIAMSVIFKQHDSLMGAGAFATGLATGIGTFMWGNVQEHKAKAAAESEQQKAS